MQTAHPMFGNRTAAPNQGTLAVANAGAAPPAVGPGWTPRPANASGAPAPSSEAPGATTLQTNSP